MDGSQVGTDNVQDANAPNITQVRQIPYWNSDSEFVISGEEFLKIKNFFSIFTEPCQIVDDIFTRSLNNGTINVKYVDNNNNEFSKEEVASYIDSLSVDKHA